MKYLVLVAIVLVVLAWLRHQARQDRGTTEQKPSAPPDTPRTPQDMVRCAHCGLHLPATDALTGTQDRRYCCAAHRDQTEA